MGSIPGLGRSSGEGNSYPLQYSGLENSMDRGAWQTIVHEDAWEGLGAGGEGDDRGRDGWMASPT